jgi:hypothetical protein
MHAMTSTTTQAAPQPMDQQQAEKLLDAVWDQIVALGSAIETLVDATWGGNGTDMSTVRYLPDGATSVMLRKLFDLRAGLASAAHEKDTYGI